MVPGHIDVIVVSGFVPGHRVIAAMIRGISKTNLVGSNEEIREDDRGSGGVNRIPVGL